MKYTQVVRSAARSANNTRIVRTIKSRPDRFRSFGVNIASAAQLVGQGLAMIYNTGTGDHHPVPRTKVSVHRLAEVAGGQHLPEIVLRKIQSQQHSNNLPIIFNGSVKHRHHLVGEPGLNHLQAALSLHPACKIVSVTAVVGLAVRSQIKSVGIGKANGVKSRIFLHSLEQISCNLRMTLTGAQ